VCPVRCAWFAAPGRSTLLTTNLDSRLLPCFALTQASKVKASELRSSSKADLLAKLTELKTELAALRVAQVSNANASKVGKIKGVRKAIARVKTVITQTQRAELRKFYANSKYLPRDLRAKRTRALRRALTPEEKYAKTERQAKKLAHFPPRRYAVKA